MKQFLLTATVTCGAGLGLLAIGLNAGAELPKPKTKCKAICTTHAYVVGCSKNMSCEDVRKAAKKHDDEMHNGVRHTTVTKCF